MDYFFFFWKAALRFANVMHITVLFASVCLLRLFLHKYLQLMIYICTSYKYLRRIWGGHNPNKLYGFFMNLLALCFLLMYAPKCSCSFRW